ncbi:MAG: hypothetical protein H0W38_05605 [Methylibium sp.]|nr:hypothetical protein [Methylibium sp.]
MAEDPAPDVDNELTRVSQRPAHERGRHTHDFSPTPAIQAPKSLGTEDWYWEAEREAFDELTAAP